MIQQRSVRAGFCSGSGGLFCALEKTKCAESDSTINGTFTFSSSREIEETPVGHGGNCFKYDTLKTFPLGKCIGGPCGANAESCGNNNEFSDDDTKSCTIQSTGFGKCGDRCSWSPNDCQNGEFWTFPVDDCSCEKVSVGGCVTIIGTHTKVTCAVSRDGCDEASVWVAAMDLPFEQQYECTLCRQPSTQSGSTQSGSTQSGSTQSENTQSESTQSEENLEVEMLMNVDESSNDGKDILLGGLAGGFVALVIFGIAFYAYRRSRKVKSSLPKSIQIDGESPGAFVGGDITSDQDHTYNTEF